MSTKRQVSPPRIDEAVHRVARRSRDLVHKRPLLPGEPVQQAGLAHVRAPEQRHAARPGRDVQRLGGRFGQRRQHRVEHLPTAATVDRAHGQRLAQAQRPQLPGLGLLPFVVNLVGRQDHGLAGSLQDPGDRAVVSGGAHDGVHHEQHGVGSLDREGGLLGNLRGQAARLRCPAPGIHDRELPPAPLGVVGHPVPGHPRDVLDDGEPAPQTPD